MKLPVQLLLIGAILVSLLGIFPPAEANAQRRNNGNTTVKAVVNPPGLFNRQSASVSGNFRGNGGVSAQAFAGGGRGVSAQAFAGRSTGFNHNFNAQLAKAQQLAALQAQAKFNQNAVAFLAAQSHAGRFNVNGFQTFDAFGRPVFVNQGRVRFNAFGTRTVVDNFGNVFEVDAFGNSRFIANKLGNSALNFGFHNNCATPFIGNFVPFAAPHCGVR